MVKRKAQRAAYKLRCLWNKRTGMLSGITTYVVGTYVAHTQQALSALADITAFLARAHMSHINVGIITDLFVGLAAWAVYNTVMQRYKGRNRPMLSSKEVEQALDDGMAEVVLQPVHHLRTNTIVGFESLIRVHHDEYGVVMPNQFNFADINDDTSRRITEFVVDKTVQYYKILLNDGYDFQMSVNLYANDINNTSLVKSIDNILMVHDMPPERLSVEVPPAAEIGATGNAERVVAGLKSLDVKLLLDDYGSRFATFGYIDPDIVDGVKLDKSLTDRITASESNAEHVRSVIHNAHSFGAVVTAKHIKTQHTAAALRQVDCDYIQGYLVAPPMTIDQARGWLKSQKTVRAQKRSTRTPV